MNNKYQLKRSLYINSKRCYVTDKTGSIDITQSDAEALVTKLLKKNKDTALSNLLGFININQANAKSLIEKVANKMKPKSRPKSRPVIETNV